MCFEKYESSTKMYRICDHFSNEHNIYKYPPCILSSESRDQTMWRTRIAFPVDLITIVSAGKKIINAKLLSQWRTFVLAVRSSKAECPVRIRGAGGWKTRFYIFYVKWL
ncbi:uncharacterized protein LOC111266590 isoform X3 [Varroa jacobsoni]|uniref:uncharacterized protein LOC111266590 isoform X3 n=1 Tax=Varroa jacobsoni TaxID=62625 RepID=UPI000BF2A885|nr:uncharacterized protein LOC111266590 isoform X3 [Varroa jacobsoni]